MRAMSALDLLAKAGTAARIRDIASPMGVEEILGLGLQVLEIGLRRKLTSHDKPLAFSL
jgi:hypothetical protein